MDEDEIAWYESQVFGRDADEKQPIYEQLADERGLVPGCYRKTPINYDEQA